MTQTSKKCKPASIGPWHESYMYMATTQDSWQTQDTLPALLFKKLNSSLPLPNLHVTTLDYHIRYATQAFKVDLQTDPLPDMTAQPPKNRERAFRNMMRKTISTLWKGQLYNSTRSHLGQPPGRKTFLHSNCPRRFTTLRSF